MISQPPKKTSIQQQPTIPLKYWESLSFEDKTEYLHLKEAFHYPASNPSKERGSYSILDDLKTVVSYINRRPDNKENRSIVSGLYYADSFICVNTRQLKLLIKRCKSSINNGFQQLGYVSDKSKVKQSILSVLPSLVNDTTLLRQWTVRTAELTTSSLSQDFMNIDRVPVYRSPPIKRSGPLPTPILKNKYVSSSFDPSFILNETTIMESSSYISSLSRPFSAPNLGDNLFSTFDVLEGNHYGGNDVSEFSASSSRVDDENVFF